MRASSSTALALAGRLRAMDDAELASLLRVREVRDVGIKDFFDLAEKLLEADSIQSALSRLNRPTLNALASVVRGVRVVKPAPAADRLAELLAHALIVMRDEVCVAYDAVAEQLESWPSRGLPSIAELADPPPAALEPLSKTDLKFTDHLAGERAFSVTTMMLEYLAELGREPARELARGGIALPDSKRLASATGADLTELPQLHSIGIAAGLIAQHGSTWVPSPDAPDWLAAANAARWGVLAEAWLAGLPIDIRQLLGERSRAVWGDHVEDYVLWLYPAGGEWMHARMREYVAFAERLGIAADSVPSSPGAALLADGPAAAVTAMQKLFPAEVDRVYLQHDLTIVSPGPLPAPIDERLRLLADVESRAIAITFRVSGPSLNRAFAAGETEESLTEFLSAIALTGIPQPLSYLLAETAARHGTLRVGVISEDRDDNAVSYVRSDDANLIGVIMADQRLSSLSLRRAGPHRIVCRFDAEIVFWSLSDARYPVAAEDAAGEIVHVARRRAPVEHPIVVDPVDTIVVRLRAAKDRAPESSRAWLERQLEVAIRAKLTVGITVRMPDGGGVDYLVEPTGLAGGRLRALDRKADIERTLPLASITEVRAAE